MCSKIAQWTYNGRGQGERKTRTSSPVPDVVHISYSHPTVLLSARNRFAWNANMGEEHADPIRLSSKAYVREEFSNPKNPHSRARLVFSTPLAGCHSRFQSLDTLFVGITTACKFFQSCILEVEMFLNRCVLYVTAASFVCSFQTKKNTVRTRSIHITNPAYITAIFSRQRQLYTSTTSATLAVAPLVTPTTSCFLESSRTLGAAIIYNAVKLWTNRSGYSHQTSCTRKPPD